MDAFNKKLIDIGLSILNDIVEDETVTKYRKQKALATIGGLCHQEHVKAKDLRPWKPRRKRKTNEPSFVHPPSNLH